MAAASSIKSLPTHSNSIYQVLTGYPESSYLNAFCRWWQITTVSPMLFCPMYLPQYISYPPVQMPKGKAKLCETARKHTLQQKAGSNKSGLPFCVHRHLLQWAIHATSCKSRAKHALQINRTCKLMKDQTKMVEVGEIAKSNPPFFFAQTGCS